MTSIGGYFELELRKEHEYHENCITLNTGRNALEYVLRAKQYTSVYLPYYICDALLEPIKRLRLNYRFYEINSDFQPLFNFTELNDGEAFVYSNYFGLQDRVVEDLSKRGRNLIIDNAQSFYSRPVKGVDTFYSPRKFFGVPDGGYLYTDRRLPDNFERDNSCHRFEHLLGRIENGAEESFSAFQKNEKKICNQPIKRMSRITQQLLRCIDYVQIAEIRQRNFRFLHERLSCKNMLDLAFDTDLVPMVYPFCSSDKGLRSRLLQHGVYCAHYWTNVFDWCDEKQLEYKLAKQLIPLPIDQRYSEDNLSIIVELLK